MVRHASLLLAGLVHLRERAPERRDRAGPKGIRSLPSEGHPTDGGREAAVSGGGLQSFESPKFQHPESDRAYFQLRERLQRTGLTSASACPEAAILAEDRPVERL